MLVKTYPKYTMTASEHTYRNLMLNHRPSYNHLNKYKYKKRKWLKVFRFPNSWKLNQSNWVTQKLKYSHRPTLRFLWAREKNELI